MRGDGSFAQLRPTNRSSGREVTGDPLKSFKIDRRMIMDEFLPASTISFGPNALIARIACFVADGQQPVPTLCELAARCVASHIPFELVEHFYPPVPEQLQLRIAFWSFPDNEEDIRLYSCLANGSADEFLRGENLYRSKSIKEPLQIGKIFTCDVSSVMRCSLRDEQTHRDTFPF